MRIDTLIAPNPFAGEARAPALPLQSMDERNCRILIQVVPQGQLVEATASIVAIEVDRRTERAEAPEHHSGPAATHLRREAYAVGESALHAVGQAAADH